MFVQFMTIVKAGAKKKFEYRDDSVQGGDVIKEAKALASVQAKGA